MSLRVPMKSGRGNLLSETLRRLYLHLLRKIELPPTLQRPIHRQRIKQRIVKPSTNHCNSAADTFSPHQGIRGTNIEGKPEITPGIKGCR